MARSTSITKMAKKTFVSILPIIDSEKFEHYLAQNLEPLDTDKHVSFHTGLQSGAFPSPGKALIVTSHTLHPLLQCAPNITRGYIVSHTIHEIRWTDVIQSCFPVNDCLELKY
jgi:hypothetical protein